MKVPHFLIINLEHSTERRVSIEKQMARYGYEYTFITAVDGKCLDKYDIPTDFDYFKSLVGSILTPGEIACAESHLRSYKFMIDNGIQRAIILEDDVVLSDDFNELLTNLMVKMKPRHELVYLGHGKAKSWPFPKKINSKYRLEKYRQQGKKSTRLIVCAAAYMVTLDAAKKLVDVAYPIRLPADYLLGLIPNHELSTYGIEPQCISFLDVVSDIDSVEDRYS